MSCKYNNCKHCGYKLECEIFKENTVLKNRNQELLQSCEGATMMYKDLCKAKDILRRMLESQPTPSSMYDEADLVGWNELCKEAKQFMGEVEK